MRELKMLPGSDLTGVINTLEKSPTSHSTMIKKIFKNSEKIFIVLSLALFSGIIIGFFSPVKETLSESNPYIKMAFALIYLVSGFLYLTQSSFNDKKRAFMKNKLFFLFVIFLFASSAWSFHPALTLGRASAFLGTVIFSLYLSQKMNSRQIIPLLGYAFFLIIILSIIAVFIFPKYGISDEYSGAWRGLYEQKNVFGKMAVFSAIIFFINLKISEEKKLFWLTMLLLSLVSAIFSSSKTALVALGFISLSYIYISRIGKMKIKDRISISIIFSLIVFVIIWVALSNFTHILSFLGKSDTLTGRTILWPMVLEKITERPLLGYGYSSFWLGYEQPSVSIVERAEWNPANAHNGVLDLFLEIGIMGQFFLS